MALPHLLPTAPMNAHRRRIDPRAFPGPIAGLGAVPGANARGMKDVYQHCSEKHLHRYLAEFDFRYSNRSKLGIEDQDRVRRALSGLTGKRLTYKISDARG
jgi:hypothetical protein